MKSSSIPLLAPTLSKSSLLKSKRHCLKYRGKNTDPVIHNIFHKYFMNPFTRLKPVRQKRKHCHLFWYPLVSTSLGSGCHMSLLVYATARDRLGAQNSAVGQKEEQKEKWRGGEKGEQRERGGGGRGEWGVIISSPPCLYIFPLLSVAPTHSSHSITQAPRTVRGPGRAFLARRASERYPDHCHCVEVRQLWRGRER